jgi:hypothetical protein
MSLTNEKKKFMESAGIPESDWEHVDFIISKESGWNPRALNPSSNACGLVQALPCSKIGSEWHNPVVALKWGHQYAIDRYGSWKNARIAWQRQRWW